MNVTVLIPCRTETTALNEVFLSLARVHVSEIIFLVASDATEECKKTVEENMSYYCTPSYLPIIKNVQMHYQLSKGVGYSLS